MLSRARDSVPFYLSSPPIPGLQFQDPYMVQNGSKTPAILYAFQPARRDEGEGAESYWSSLSKDTF